MSKLLFLLPILTSLPDDIEGLWNMDLMGYTTVGAIVSVIGSIAYTQIRASIQRKAVAKGLSNTTLIQDKHYKELIEYKANSDIAMKEMREDLVKLAKTSVRKEAQEIAKKWEIKLEQPKVDLSKEVIQPIINEIKKSKKKFR